MSEMPASGVRYSFGGPLTPTVRILIIINVVTYLLMRLTTVDDQIFYSFLGLRPSSMLADRAFWQLISYMFIHDNGILHIGLNMLVLWWFGADIERGWGSKLFLRYYLLSGIFAGLTVVAFTHNSNSVTIGASGAIMALLIAFATTYPNRTLLFMFVFPMKAKYMVLLIAAIEIFSTTTAAQDNVSHFAHIGGLAFGAVWYLYFNGRGRFTTWRRLWRRRRHRGRLKLVTGGGKSAAAGVDTTPTIH